MNRHDILKTQMLTATDVLRVRERESPATPRARVGLTRFTFIETVRPRA